MCTLHGAELWAELWAISSTMVPSITRTDHLKSLYLSLFPGLSECLPLSGSVHVYNTGHPTEFRLIVFMAKKEHAFCAPLIPHFAQGSRKISFGGQYTKWLRRSLPLFRVEEIASPLAHTPPTYGILYIHMGGQKRGKIVQVGCKWGGGNVAGKSFAEWRRGLEKRTFFLGPPRGQSIIE